MPSERTPRSSPAWISLPSGSTEPSSAVGIRSPSFWFCAPVTIWMGFSLPTSTSQTHMWSLFSWRTILRMRPATTFFIFSCRSSNVSTLEPERVIASANSRSPTALQSTKLFSHFLLSNIFYPLLSQNCSRKRTSFSKIRRRSLILKRRIASRSRPMPKAQPE